MQVWTQTLSVPFHSQAAFPELVSDLVVRDGLADHRGPPSCKGTYVGNTRGLGLEGQSIRGQSTDTLRCAVYHGAAKIPRVFKVVKDIKRVDDGTVRLVGNGRLKVEIPVQLGFLETATLEGLVE